MRCKHCGNYINIMEWIMSGDCMPCWRHKRDMRDDESYRRSIPREAKSDAYWKQRGVE